MELRDLVVTHLLKAVGASAIILLFNIYTEGMTTPIRLGTEFLLPILAIFVGFIVFSSVKIDHLAK
ncbi:hypothetical protein SAMN04488556_1441 [Halostagnicola kamekurae]|uniref:Uncharacterized protein n=1 Tax=Halostagnicola kamekurae TaxID=619731 RepID=A0A1I6QPY4_9EURY|nr:hypothetical protein SAMN04488556_1441 [Halostagnicola kamekurae]